MPGVVLRWIPRDQNSEADALSKRAIGVSYWNGMVGTVAAQVVRFATGRASAAVLHLGR